MTIRTLIFRSLRFHARSHIGVVVGAAVGTAALVGALVVGDSVRESLRERAEARVGWVVAALHPTERNFPLDLAHRLGTVSPAGSPQSFQPRFSSVLRLPGVAAMASGSARANHVFVLGVQPDFWNINRPTPRPPLPDRSVVLNETLAAQLQAKVGDEILLRVRKPSALAQDVPLAPREDSSRSLRLTVHAIAGSQDMGEFDLEARPQPPFNAFVRLEELSAAVGLPDRVNLLLVGNDDVPLNGLDTALKAQLTLGDLGLDFAESGTNGFLDLRTPQVFLDAHVAPAAATLVRPSLPTRPAGTDASPPSVEALLEAPRWASARQSSTNPAPILTYLVNQFRAGSNLTPYSMVTAAGAPWTLPDQKDDEILVNEWLAADLQVKPGDPIDVGYFLPESGGRLEERIHRFRVRAVVPLAGVYADRSLMPDFPGIAKAESTHDWDAGFPLVHKVRDKDDAYWKQYRGTPKAFVTFQAGQTMWSNRFGNLTALRWKVPQDATPAALKSVIERNLLASLNPADFGMHFEPVRSRALAGAQGSQDFGGLFVGFSFFLIGAALILMAMLFQFHLEQRRAEVGLLLALGFAPKQVRRLLLGEGVSLALVGGLLGTVGGVAYARAMLHGLNHDWRAAIASTSLSFHATSQTLALGLVIGVVVCVATFAVVLRRQARQPARELLADGIEYSGALPARGRSRRRMPWASVGSGLLAVGLVGWALVTGQTANAGIFFGAGSLFLLAALTGCSALFTRLASREAGRDLTLVSLGIRGCTRRRSRSLATIGLLAGGSFIVVAIAAFKLDADQDAWSRRAGTGGFALIGQTALPVVQDLNTAAGRDYFSFSERATDGVAFVPLRVREGDDASCLNLNQAQKPRLLGVNPELLAQRNAFTFSGVAAGLDRSLGWRLLASGPKSSGAPLDEIPAIGDANSIQWALKKGLGDTLPFTDEHGRVFKVRLVGAVANSILQGNLLIDEAEFTRRFPKESGYRMFLVDAPSNGVAQASVELSRALLDVGAEWTPATARLAQFNAVQNTYLNTFQVLGGLGLLLGSAGLGVVVLRNVLERRAELGLLQAVGFRRRRLNWLVLSEHVTLLGLGLAAGVCAAAVAILPQLLSPGAALPLRSLTLTLGGVLLSGWIWTWLASWLALRGKLLDTLRNE